MRRLAQSWLTARWLRYVGAISYGLYIYRSLILYLLGIPLHQSQVHGAPGLLVAAFLLISFTLAALSYHVVESPILRLKGRLTGRHVPAAASAPHPLQPVAANR